MLNIHFSLNLYLLSCFIVYIVEKAVGNQNKASLFGAAIYKPEWEVKQLVFLLKE